MSYIRVGMVLKPQGIKGEVKVLPMTDDPARFNALEEVYIEKDGSYRKEKVASVCVRDGGAYIVLEGVKDRDGAEKLRGAHLCVDRRDAVKLPQGRYFICDLVGCQVYDTKGALLGKLTEVAQNGPVDVYSIQGGKGLLMVPALKALLAVVDVEGKRIELDGEILEQVGVWDED